MVSRKIQPLQVVREFTVADKYGLKAAQSQSEAFSALSKLQSDALSTLYESQLLKPKPFFATSSKTIAIGDWQRGLASSKIANHTKPTTAKPRAEPIETPEDAAKQRGQTMTEILYAFAQGLLTTVCPPAGIGMGLLHAAGATRPLDETTGELPADTRSLNEKVGDVFVSTALSAGVGEFADVAAAVFPVDARPIAKSLIGVAGDRAIDKLTEKPPTASSDEQVGFRWDPMHLEIPSVDKKRLLQHYVKDAAAIADSKVCAGKEFDFKNLPAFDSQQVFGSPFETPAAATPYVQTKVHYAGSWDEDGQIIKKHPNAKPFETQAPKVDTGTRLAGYTPIRKRFTR